MQAMAPWERPVKKMSQYRSAGACPPRSLPGEGQALALREGEAFFSPQRRACHRDIERFMKHPQIIKKLDKFKVLCQNN